MTGHATKWPKRTFCGSSARPETWSIRSGWSRAEQELRTPWRKPSSENQPLSKVNNDNRMSKSSCRQCADLIVVAQLRDQLRRKYRALEPHLDEKARRLWAGTEARELGHGGATVVAEATGLTVAAVRRGVRDVKAGDAPSGRVRRKPSAKPGGLVVATA